MTETEKRNKCKNQIHLNNNGKSNSMSRINKQILSTVSWMILINGLTGCLKTLDKKPVEVSMENSNLFRTPTRSAKVEPKKNTQILTDATPPATPKTAAPEVANIESEASCKDRSIGGSYSEDERPDCVREQTLRAYKAFDLNMDPETPYCILRQESSIIRGREIKDPYNVQFDRLAINRIKKSSKRKGKSEVIGGVGLAQFTMGTWTSHQSTLDSKPEQHERLTQCLNDLAKATNQPMTYNKPMILQFNKGNLKHDLELALQQAKTKPPTEVLNPLYRDHAICMNALHLSELRARISSSSAKPKYAIRGRGKKRHKVLITQSATSLAGKIGGAYNGGGTPGYGGDIHTCVTNFRTYDQSQNVSDSSIYIRSLQRFPANEVAGDRKYPQDPQTGYGVTF